MGGFNSYDQDLKTLSDPTPELNVGAYSQDESSGMLRDCELEAPIIMGKSILIPGPVAKGHAHKSKKRKLNKALNYGGVKIKVNSDSKKGPAEWRRMALRQVLAGVS